MITKKLRQLINEFRIRSEHLKLQNELIKIQNEQLIAQIAELEWAHIFHDTIKGKDWLKDLSISPGRWAGNYSFFYVLVRILAEGKPGKIIEFGLGESSKIIAAFLKKELPGSTHLIVEQDINWIAKFKERFALPVNSTILNLPIEEKIVGSHTVNCYSGLPDHVKEPFDFYIVDGPCGSEKLSRYDICFVAEKLQLGDEFIILMDDYHRQGERDTAHELVSLLKSKSITIYNGFYGGNKSQIVITTEKYRLFTSM